jgi:nitrous oxidase accessory protein
MKDGLESKPGSKHRADSSTLQQQGAFSSALQKWSAVFSAPKERENKAWGRATAQLRESRRMNKSALKGRKNVCLWMSLFFCVVTAQAETLTVGASADFHSVQSAINAARPGDVIRVEPGVYTERITLDKQLTLAGAGKPILRGTGEGSVVIVAADRCTISGFIIERSGGSLQEEDSGLLVKSADNLVEDNELRDVLFGVYLYHASRNTVRRNLISGRRALEVGERGAGLHVWNSADNLFEENTISDARDGLYIQTSPGNVVRRNRVTEVRYGLHYMNSDDNRFEDNLFAHNVAGAAIMYSRRIQLRRNAFAHNRGFSSFGILFQDCDEIVAEDNYVIDNATGIFMEALRKSAFRRNVIAENDLALQLYASSDQNLFAENNFIENLSPLSLVGKRSTTRWQENGRGNYWSEYEGYDLNGDGVGDVAHRVQNVFEYLEGNFPRLRLYLNSAAAQSLATAEKTFPIIKGSAETDSAPLVRAVSMQSPLTQTRPQFQTQALLGCASLAMFGCGAIAVWKGQRR